VSSSINNLEIVDEAKIRKTAAYHRTKNGFNIHFLENVLSEEIARLVELQTNTVNTIEAIIEDLKKRPYGGSENG
jgi:hypothetical protein